MDEVVEKFEETVVAELLIEIPEVKKLRNLVSNCLSRLYLLEPLKKLMRLSRNLKRPSLNRLPRL